MMNNLRAPAIHFVGIGGIGMSALARYFNLIKKGGERWHVSGSDAVASELTRALAREGIKISIGHKKGNITKDIDIIVYNRAITSKNPELVAGRARGIKTIPYAKVLGEITKLYTTIAITGSHGKSTTTAMTGLVFLGAKLDPTILVGTKLKELPHENMRIGRGRYLVLEADDYAGAFWSYSPSISLVTNIDREHIDFYKSFPNTKKAFLRFIAQTTPGGTVVMNRDDAQARSLAKKIEVIARKKNLRVVWYTAASAAARKIKKIIKVPGEHNLSNALAAHTLGTLLKISERTILAGIATYRGAWRRMELRGSFLGASVFDDYAHHPTEIKATLSAFRGHYPAKKIICVFQPHQSKRLNALFKEFTAAFDDADEIIMLPVYKVNGRDERRLKEDAATLVRAIQTRNPQKNIHYLSGPRLLKKTLTSLPYPLSSAVIIMMGAGDIVVATESLL